MANVVRIVIEAIDKTKVGLTTPIHSLKDLQGAVDKLGPAMKAMSLAAAGAFAVFAKSSFNAAEEMRKMNTTLSVASGSMEGAAKEMSFVARVADDLGLDLLQAANGFAGISAAANGTALEGQKIRDVYEGVSTAVAALTLSADDTRGVLTALTQIISKGTVSSDELKQQLGERLPGAFQIAARSMGITTEEMSKLLEQGKIIASDFLPGFAEELKKTFGPAAATAAESYTANVARLKNQFFLLQVEVGQQLLPEMVALTGAFSDWLKEGSNAETVIATLVSSLQTLKQGAIGVYGAFKIMGTAIGVDLANRVNLFEKASNRVKRLLIELKATAKEKTTGSSQNERNKIYDELKQNEQEHQNLLKGRVDTLEMIAAEAKRINDLLDYKPKPKEDVYGPIEPPGSKKYNDDPLDAMGIPTYLKAPSFNVETQSKEQQKLLDGIRDANDKIFLSEEALLKKKFNAQMESVDAILGNTAEGQEALFMLHEQFVASIAELDSKSAEEEIERQQKISDLRFELKQAGLDAETEQAEILENLREQQYQNDLARIDSLKLKEDEARELKAAAEKAYLAQKRADERAAELTEKQLLQIRVQAAKTAFGNMASASAVFFGEQSAAYKAFAILEATAATFLAANIALATPAPWPLPQLFASAAIVSGLANVAKISGIAHGGLTEVPSDQTFLLKQGERVLSPDQNEDFTEFIGDGRGGGGGMMNLTINLDGQPLYSGISKASKDGRFTISARAVS